MFAHLNEQPKDKILALMAAYKEDPRDTKVDLGVGVYKDASGNTPVMRAVKAAERQLVNEQDSKSYVGLAGDPAFSDAMIDLVLDGAVARDRVAAVATPGGTGAIDMDRAPSANRLAFSSGRNTTMRSAFPVSGFAACRNAFRPSNNV